MAADCIARLYARVSSEEQAISGTSLDNQAQDLVRWAEYQELDYRIYSDPGYSGKTDQRPGLRALLDDVAPGDVVAVTKLDRAMRNLRLLLLLIDLIEEKGATFHSINEGLYTNTDYGKFALNVMASVAEFERSMIAERTRQGRYSRYANGQWGPGQPSYGYRYNKGTKCLDIDPAEAEIVNRIYNMYLYDRLGLQRIAQRLNLEGVTPRQQARQWHKTAVSDIVLHPGYKGEHPTGAKCPDIVDPDVWGYAPRAAPKCSE